MLDVKEALNLELLDDYITSKANSLNQEIMEYNDLTKKYRLFVTQYKEGISSLADALGKKVEGIHNMIDSFVTSYEAINNKIKDLEAELLRHNHDYEGEISAEVENVLLEKLNNEVVYAKKKVNELLDSYIKEYDEYKKLLDKAITKLQRLKSKEIKA